MSSKHPDVPLSFRRDTSLEGIYIPLLRPSLPGHLLCKGRLPSLRSCGGVSNLSTYFYSPFVGPGGVYPPSPLLELLQRGSRGGLPPPHYLVNRRHDLVVGRVRPLYWWTLVCVIILGQNQQGYVDIWPPYDLSFVDVDNAPDFRDR